MVRKESVRSKATNLPRELQESPEITKFLEEFAAQFAEYALPIEELHRRMRAELGDISLTEELYRMRQE